MYITGKDNFRDEEATIKPYKGNRNSPKPHHYQKIKDFFKQTKDMEVVWCDGYEADDAMAMEQYKHVGHFFSEVDLYEINHTIICSLDKDLRMVKGWHFEWSRTVRGKRIPSKTYLVDEIEGQRWFYQQLLMGDSTDNIPGLYNWGPAKSKELIEGITDELDLYIIVREMYEKYFGSYWELFLHENARLLWMLRSEEDDIREILSNLERARLERFAKEF